MVAILGDVATSTQAGGLANKVLNGLVDARKKSNLESYTIGGSSEVSGSTIDIGHLLPKGARVHSIMINVSVAQTSLTISIGDDASATRYASAITSLQTAGTYLISGKNYKTGQTDGDRQIVITTGGATMTAGQLEVVVDFSID